MPYQLSVPAHATVLRAARAMYPHDGLPDEAYEKVVRKLEADAAADGGIAATIDEGVAALGDGEIDEALLRKHADDPFVALLQSTAVVELYDNPLVWNAFGYEGPSTHLGGYKNRGFDDLDWLPDPPLTIDQVAAAAAQRQEA